LAGLASPRTKSTRKAEGIKQLGFTPLADFAALFAARQLSPVDLVRALLSRIEAENQLLRAYVTVCPELALRQAQAAERAFGHGHAGAPLLGIPIAHKDVIFTAGVRTTAHSRSLLDFVPQYDAAVVRSLAEAGMALLGKTNTTEFAFGDMAIFGTARNPWRMTHYTGGSSAGSAGAVAAGLAIAATGTDSLGSIRIPASFCGVVGLKPTYGLVSRFGIAPLGWSLDHVGPITRTVRDAALLLNVMAGPDPRDPESVGRPHEDFSAKLEAGVGGAVLAVPEWALTAEVHPETAACVRAALSEFERLGARVESFPLQHPSELVPVGRLLLMVEGFAAHRQRLQKAAALYGPRVRRRLSTGALFTAVQYQQALRVRHAFAAEVDRVLLRTDALVTPTVPFPAFSVEAQEHNPPENAAFTCPFSLSGHPALSIPCGFTRDGLPVGLQLIGKRFGEAALFGLAHAYEDAVKWYRRRPPTAQPTPTSEPAPAGGAAPRAPASPALQEWVEAEAASYGLALDGADLEAIAVEFAHIRATLPECGVAPWYVR
jgi:aspartyl-tRNA(Asn)/glutamyl-tRNA(Gln) amidotransferase subunit A